VERIGEGRRREERVQQMRVEEKKRE